MAKIGKKKINEIKKRNKTPILVGGTGLYFKALTEGLVEIPSIPLTFRNKVRKLQSDLGQKKFYKKLIKLDPLLVKQIDPTDTQRSIRAYEVKKFTNKSIVSWYENTKPDFKKKDFFRIVINYPRHLLIERIKIRVERMLEIGAILEVKKLLKLKISKDKSIFKAIGVNEIREYIKKLASKEEIIDKISIKTRQYAKRQVTWVRGHMNSWKKINSNRLNSFLKKI